MKSPKLKIEIDKLNFNQIVQTETVQYLEQAIRKGFDANKIINDGIKRFTNQQDKIACCLETINYLSKKIEETNLRIRYDFIENYEQKSSTDKNFRFDIYDYQQYQDYKQIEAVKIKYESMIFYAVRELERLGISNLENDAFTIQEVKDINVKIDAVLNKLNEIQLGQGIIHDVADDLKNDFLSFKSDFPLGKKRWYQRATGAVISYAGTKVSDEVLELLKPELRDFFQHQAVPLLTKFIGL